MTQSVTVPLTDAIEIDGRPVSELTFRKAKMRDFIAGDAVASGGHLAKVLGTLASMAGVSFTAMQEVSYEDFKIIDRDTAVLMGNAPTTEGGET